MSFATIQIAGPLPRPAEVKYTQSQDPKMFVSFTIPVNVYVRNGENETQWWNVDVFGKQAERLANLMDSHGALDKGCVVFASGTPKIDIYQKNDGTTGTAYKVQYPDKVEIMTKLEARNQQGQGYQQQAPQQGYAQQQYQQAPPTQPQQQYQQQPQQQQGVSVPPPPPGFVNYGQS